MKTLNEEIKEAVENGKCPWCGKDLNDGQTVTGHWHKDCYDEYVMRSA